MSRRPISPGTRVGWSSRTGSKCRRARRAAEHPRACSYACVGHEGDGAKGDGYRLASSRVSLVLAMEVALSRRQTKSAARNPPVDPRHEPCQPTLGCSPDPWRTPQARHQCGSNLGRQIYGRSTGTPIARMEDVPARCCTGLCQFRPNRVKYGRTRTTSTTLFRVCQQCRVSVSPGRVRDYSYAWHAGVQAKLAERAVRRKMRRSQSPSLLSPPRASLRADRR
jgi:(2Fe-2S) ferredoxin